MIKKRLALFILAAFCTLGISACGSSETTGTSSAENNVQQEDIAEKENSADGEVTESEPKEIQNTESDSADDSSEDNGDVDAAILWLDSIGAYEDMKDWASDEDIISLYNSIQADMETWGVSMEDMRLYVEDFDPNLTLDEIAALTDYQIYIDYAKLMGYAGEVDAEEDFGDENIIYVATDEELKAYIRDDTYIGTTFQFPAYMVGGTDIDNKYTAYINVEDATGHNGPLAAYITKPSVNLFEGDYILYTGIYDGMYENGFLKFTTISVELK